MLLLALSGLLLLRFATRQLLALLFQLPPRMTRFEPCGQNRGIVDFRLTSADYLLPFGLCSGGNAETTDDLPPQGQRVRKTDVGQQRFHVTCQVGF